MKIVLVTETFPPEVNGVAMTLNRLASGLSQKGHQLTVIRPRQNKDDHSGLIRNIQHITVPGLPLPGYDGLHFGLPSANSIKQVLTDRSPDLVHVATEGPLGWTAIRLARKHKVPLSSSFHTNFHAYGKHYGFGLINGMVLKYLRTIHNKTAATFAPSDDLLQTLNQTGFENLHLLGRGVDTELFNPNKRDCALRAQWGVSEDQPVAVYVGRVAKEKNINLTIQAYQTMQATIPDLKMMIVGDGPERIHLQKTHPEIHFSGMRRDDDLARHYASGDLFLFGSTTETFGNVVTEAMASGLLVMAFDYAAPQRYITANIDGVLVPYADEAAFIEQATALALKQGSWPAMRAAACDKVRELSWGTIIEGFEKTLIQLANREQPETYFNNQIKTPPPSI
jgi:glycosyltransferase involved in cell wall biosynthesis